MSKIIEQQALRIAKAEGDTSTYYGVINLFLGIIYEALKEYGDALKYYQEAYDVFKNYPETNMGDLGSSATNVSKMLMYKDPKLTISFLEDFVRKFPAVTSRNVYQSVQTRLMQAYQKTGDIEKSNAYCAALLKKVGTLSGGAPLNTYVAIIQYYIITRQYSEAMKYLPEFKLQAEKRNEKPLVREAVLYQFKIDSASGDFNAAMKQYMLYKRITDTLFNETKTKEIAKLRVQYESEKKDNDLKLKEQSIALLTKEAALQQAATLRKDQELELRAKSIELLKAEQELQQLEVNNANREVQVKDQTLKIKEQNIALLTKESFIKEANLRESRLFRNVMIGGAILLLVLLLLLFNRYKLRQGIIKQMGINNSILKKMNNEKEWLLKEVHHRVKNNLQTVVSLLQSQSAYLQNDAYNAIQDSQNRIHAMSLVHQKLYRTDNMASINMSTYLSDLVGHLFDSYNARRITYQVNAQPIELDVSQAISVGLIVNEAVTNSLKYAFTDSVERRNELVVTFYRQQGQCVLLTISDNGKGLPVQPAHSMNDGLGLSLMKGLSDDLAGKFRIESMDGTTVSLLFEASVPLQNMVQVMNVESQ